MKALIVVTLAVCSLAVAGCTPPSHRREASELQDKLHAMARVDNVELAYEEPIALDAADVNLEVTMIDGARPEDVAGVVDTAYDRLTDSHRDEEGNLTVVWDDNRLTLRSFKSTAETADVVEVALAGARVAATYGKVRISIMTQDVDSPSYVDSWVVVRLPRRTPQAEVDRVRAGVEKTYGDLSVHVDVRVARR